MSVFSSLYGGFTVNFPEEPETAMEDLYEIAPTLVVASPTVVGGDVASGDGQAPGRFFFEAD